MPKNRTTAQQRARQIQRAPGARLPYGKSLEAARSRQLHPDQARKALRELIEADDIAGSWRDCLRGHLAAADHADWPTTQDAISLCEDLYVLSGTLAPAEVLPGIPPALRYFPLDHLHAALKTGSAADYLCAAVAALTGPLRHLLRRPYLARPQEDDVTYHARKMPTAPSRPRQMVTVHTVDGLHIEDISFPRPWGTPTTTGYFTCKTAPGREDLARAVLAHALGGTAPTSRASCGTCHGNGWLTALDPEHNTHVPAYRPDGGHVCICGGCRGTGLRPLPVQLFAATFLRRLQARTGPEVSRREILEWTAAHAPAQHATGARCTEGPQDAYVRQVVAAVTDAGFTAVRTDVPGGYELDFDEQGVLGAHFVVGGEAAARAFHTDSALLFWFSDRGWSVTGFGKVRRLLPDDLVPAPHAVAQALVTPATDDGAPSARRPPLHLDPYTAVLAYLAPAHP
ncbi:DUF6292 family protein [Streptomyces sp. B29(2018)]|uniref:DUF6292 family protein n=1 Tax=Streptomyces sp. B29(2018) TaxID=2485016 RepID=UPI000FD66F93|nr:DUF6292 family protein [Streptomyces sp. B29(2018)]